MKKLSLLAALSVVVLLAGCVNTNPTDEEITEDVAGIEYVEDVVDYEEVEDVVDLEDVEIDVDLEDEIVNE